MSEPLRGIVVSHARLAGALVEAVERIAGQKDGLVAVSNEGCDRGLLEAKVAEAVGQSPAVVFVDLPSGSCLHASAHYFQTHENVAVVAGVSLAMLVDFLYHRDLSPKDAAERAVQTGTRALRVLSR
jgi:mannose/fructose-specific phosphotransferase system component IIA